MIFKILFVFYFIHNYCDGRTSEVLKVTLPNKGKLVGRYLTSQNGTGFRAFMGVPYAEPPIGELRFKVNPKLKNTSETTLNSFIPNIRNLFKQSALPCKTCCMK